MTTPGSGAERQHAEAFAAPTPEGGAPPAEIFDAPGTGIFGHAESEKRSFALSTHTIISLDEAAAGRFDRFDGHSNSDQQHETSKNI